MSKAAAQKPIPVSDLAYRPRDYFGRYDLQAELLSSVKTMDCLEGNFDDDVEEMLGFFTAESEFYPCFDQTLRERVLERFINPT